MPPAIILAARTLGIPFLAGLNLYVTVFALGLIKKITGAAVLGPEFEVLASWPVLIVSGVLLIIEIVADKIPAVDHVWDAIHTFIRTPGAMVVIAILTQGQSLTWQVIAVLVAGSIAFMAHSAKATTRAASTKATATAANASISVAEDILVIIGSILAAFYPIILGVLVVVILVLAAVFGPRLLRAARITGAITLNYVKYLWGRFRRWIQPHWRPRAPEVKLPAPLLDLALKDDPVSKARVLIGDNGRRRFGHIVMWPDRMAVYAKRGLLRKVATYYYKELENAFADADAMVDRLFFEVRGRAYVVSFFKGLEPTAAGAARLIESGRAKP
ncbi:MAG: DUF4126 domain-containing protein [Candidatus Zixiibacteriota bacterium]|jgi:hypothetical protein